MTLSQWRWFYRESVRYIAPHTRREWLVFFCALPVAWLRFLWYSRRDYCRVKGGAK